jgi:hypothetical protein
VAAVYRWWSALVVLAIVVQIGFAGYGAFGVAKDAGDGSVDEDKFDDRFGPHTGFGYLVVLMILLLLIFGAVARVGRPRIVWSAVLFGLGILQILLAWFGSDVPAIGALHPINAFLILGLAGRIAYANFRGARAVETTARAV